MWTEDTLTQDDCISRVDFGDTVSLSNPVLAEMANGCGKLCWEVLKESGSSPKKRHVILWLYWYNKKKIIQILLWCINGNKRKKLLTKFSSTFVKLLWNLQFHNAVYHIPCTLPSGVPARWTIELPGDETGDELSARLGRDTLKRTWNGIMRKLL